MNEKRMLFLNFKIVSAKKLKMELKKKKLLRHGISIH